MAITNSTIGSRRFKHLMSYDRRKIATLYAAGKTQQEIADYIGCHKSTISRELRRGTLLVQEKLLRNLSHKVH